MAEDRGSWLSVATALFFAWAFLSCCVRVWVSVGRKQSWGNADTGIVAAIVRLFSFSRVYSVSDPFLAYRNSTRGRNVLGYRQWLWPLSVRD